MSFHLGLLVGLLLPILFVLAFLVRFVSSDLDGFRRWMDKATPEGFVQP